MSDTSTTEITPIVDYEKSIKRNRLVYKITPEYIFDSILSWIVMGFYITIGLIPLLFKLTNGNHAPILVMIIALLYLLWMISNMLLRNTLVKIEGTNVIENKQHLLDTMDAYFSNYDFSVNDNKMMRSYMPTGNPIWGRIITILIDENSMLLNVATLGKGNFPTFAHGLWNFLKAKRIAKYFKSNYGR